MAINNDYLDAYLEPCPGYGWQGGDAFKTLIVEMANGRERRNAEVAQARHQYQAPYNNITKEAYRNIKQMHLVCRGMLRSFKFRDELDYQAEDEAFGVGNGVQTEFQLLKQSLVDGVSYQRYVYAIEAATVEVNGTPTAVTIDYDRGLVTFGVAPAGGAALTWSGTFAVWVRFNQDYLPFSIDNLNAVNGSVDLIEVQPPPEEGS
jgi:uncharacterized protein (TIGR02217 family)